MASPEGSTQSLSGQSEDTRSTSIEMSGIDNITTLEGLQSDEQRQILDIIAELRKCGLESILLLPQIVVCGDQSAGKSSLLEALTEIPFPRNDNLCTRFATEIILRRAAVESLTIKIIPGPKRTIAEQQTIAAFKASITSFEELPRIMAEATALMGIDGNSSAGTKAGAFARDVLSIEIEGPSRPQLTLVDLPGLIQTKTKGVTDADIDLVNEITDHYISQSRTICLAVISATNDYANQGILTKVRKVDPDGERTLGVITKPDRLIPDSGMEKSFIGLARNEDIFFKLGWHVLKNRSFEEGTSSFLERNASEDAFFRRSNFKSLPGDSVGVDSLRERLSRLLFNHVKQELPKLRQDLDTALTDAKDQMRTLGKPRATPSDCRDYLMSVSLEYYDNCKAAINGNYQGSYFTRDPGQKFSVDSPASIRRLRAVIQTMNQTFSDEVRTRGHKYVLERSADETTSARDDDNNDMPRIMKPGTPTKLSQPQTLKWANEALIRTRGRELIGNFNPLVVGELFWEQSGHWRILAEDHVDRVADICSQFLSALLNEKCPKDVRSRVWESQIRGALSERKDAAIQELDRIWEDLRDFPINYNHYYTDTVKEERMERMREDLTAAIESATTHSVVAEHPSHNTPASVDINLAVRKFSRHADPDMDKISCEEALDCLLAIYKVEQKTFIANVTTQVIERHVVRGLQAIFCPVSVNRLTDLEAQSIVSEPASARRQRGFLEDRTTKLKNGHAILRGVIGGVAV